MANKARQIEDLKERFFPDKQRLTKNQKLWLEEYRKAQNRVDEWAKKFRASYELPQKAPKVIKKKNIEQLKNVNWRKFTEKQKQIAREEFEVYYEGEVPEVYSKQKEYVPPTEADWIEGYDPLSDMIERPEMYWDEEKDEEGYSIVLDSEEELRKWIEKVIESVVVSVSPWGTPNELYGERDKIKELVYSAFNNAKNKFKQELKFLAYLEQNANEIHELTLKAIHGYESDGQRVYLEEGGESAMAQIMTILNFGSPIGQTAEEDFMNGDFGDTFWGSGEDFYE